MTDYLGPKASAPARTRKMENGIFSNPPTYTALGGFTSERSSPIRPANATRSAAGS